MTKAAPLTRTITVHLLRSIECPHDPAWHRVVSDCVVYTGTSNTPDGPQDYEIARQIIACTACGWVVDVVDVDRDPT